MNLGNGIDYRLVKKLRKQRGLTLKGLSALTRLNPGTLSRIEAGARRDPKGTTVYRLAQAFGVSMETLMLP